MQIQIIFITSIDYSMKSWSVTDEIDEFENRIGQNIHIHFQ